MRILQVHNFYATPGGECSVVRAEKKLLESRGHEVCQFSYDSGAIHKYSLVQKGLVFAQIPYNIQSSRALSRFVQKNRPDIAHVHNVFPLLSPSVYVALKRLHVPVVQTIHNYRFLCPNGLLYTQNKICEACLQRGFISAVQKRCMRNSTAVSLLYASAIWYARKSKNIFRNIDRYIALNRFSADKLIAGGVPGKNIRICGNFVEKISDNPSAKKDYILYIGRLSLEKGLWTLIKALQKMPAVTLKLAGRGPLETELRNYVAKNCCTNIEFTGFVDGSVKERLIGEALCSVIPSEWYENFPVSVLESLSMGTPVIASRMGGLPEMIEDGITGLLYTAGDADELTTAIKTIVNDKRRTKNMSVEALKTAKSRFGSEQHYCQLMTIYEEVVHTRRLNI